jgi:hypothetical protein
MKQARPALAFLVAGTTLFGWACSDKKEAGDASTSDSIVGPAAVGRTSSDGEPTTPLASPSPSPTAGPVLVAGGTCPLGKGSVKTTCSRSALGRFFPQVDAAIAQAVQQRPELFDLTRKVGENGYLVRDVEGFYEEVARLLQAAGLCARYDFERILLQVKDSNTESEDYDLVLSNGHLRRGEGSYRSTCTPSAFPLDPQDIIDDIRVAFYSIECRDDAPPPRNGEGKLRMECVGIVTATPKKADNTDVHERTHGPDIKWKLTQIDDYVEIFEFPNQPFNMYVKGLDPGGFTLCATVQGITGCLNGVVLEE